MGVGVGVDLGANATLGTAGRLRWRTEARALSAVWPSEWPAAGGAVEETPGLSHTPTRKAVGRRRRRQGRTDLPRAEIDRNIPHLGRELRQTCGGLRVQQRERPDKGRA